MTAQEPQNLGAPASAVSRPPRTTGRQAWVTAAAGAVAFVLGTVAAGLLSAPAGSAAGIAAGALSLPLAVWLGLIGVLALVLPHARARTFAVWAVVAAPVATILSNLPTAAYGGWLLIVLAWQAAGLAGAALVGAIAGVVARRHAAADAAPHVPPGAEAVDPAERTPSRERTPLFTWVTLGLLTVGSALAFALPTQWLAVYFAIWDAPPPPTTADGIRYLWTAGLALAFLAAALVVAVIRRGRGLVVLTAVALGCAMIGALVFQVPQGRFAPQPGPVDDGRDHPVCYGTTGDCPGG